MPEVRSLKDRVCSSIHTAEDLLATMMTPAQSPAQITLHVEYLKRMSGLTYEVEKDLLVELKDFITFMIYIGRRASAIYKDLCTWETSISRAHTELLYTRKSVHEGKDYRKRGAIGIAKCDHANISYDYDYLVQEVTEHENYLTAEDHVITKGIKKR